MTEIEGLKDLDTNLNLKHKKKKLVLKLLIKTEIKILTTITKCESCSKTLYLILVFISNAITENKQS